MWSGEDRAPHGVEQAVGGRGDELDVVARAEDDEPRRDAIVGLAGGVKPKRGADTGGDGAGDRGEGGRIAAARALLGLSLGRLAEDADRRPPRGETGEGVDVLDELLAGNDARARLGGRLGGEHALAEELVGRVAGDEPRLRIERVPARGIAIDDPPQPGRELAVADERIIFLTTNPPSGGRHDRIRDKRRGANRARRR
jgi:hypothetical protein